MAPFQLDDSQSLHRKWLEITKHPFINGCLGFQVSLFDSLSKMQDGPSRMIEHENDDFQKEYPWIQGPFPGFSQFWDCVEIETCIYDIFIYHNIS